jgi:hypothetical protein
VAQVARVEVTIADVEPIARFIARVCKAGAMMRDMTAGEAAALPGAAAAGIAELQAAVRDLGVSADPVVIGASAGDGS